MGRLLLLGVGVAASGGLSTTPSYIASGVPDVTSGGGPIPPFEPAYGTNAAGDLFLCAAVTRIEVAGVSIITPSGWTLQQIHAVSAYAKVYIFTRDARSTGSETGTVALEFVGGTGGPESALAVIHTFRNVATSSFIEGIVTHGETSDDDTIDAPGVTASGVRRLACAIGGSTAQLNVTSFTDESGGDWVSRSNLQTGEGTDCSLWLQTAALDSGGSISGGSVTVASAEEWSGIGFCLVGT